MSGVLKEAFRGMKEAKEEPPARPPLPLGKTGKSSHPQFEPVKVYLRKTTRKDAFRKWQDENGGDLSDLVQHLLTEYLSS